MWMVSKLYLIFFFLLFISCSALLSGAEDWPMWRYDAARTAASPQQLASELHRLWVRNYPQPVPVWDDPLNQDLMQYDTVYEPVVLGKTLFLGFNSSDRITALNTDTGEEKWSFFADGPVRLPPVAGQGKVYFVSDDGCLYCLDAERGVLIWSYRGVPRDRLLLGNERLISTWCARGGPALKDGIIYFGAGIWPFMGVFLFAIDAENGREIWVNDGVGSIFMKQPHNSPSFASVAPQGSFVLSGGKLLVPGGRSVPACFDAKTGEYLYYRLADNGKTGGAFVCAEDSFFLNYYRDQTVNLYDLKTGDLLINAVGGVPVIATPALYCKGEILKALDLSSARQVEKTRLVRSSAGDISIKTDLVWTIDFLWSVKIDSRGDLIKAGNRLYAGGNNCVSAIDLIQSVSREPAVSWQTQIDGEVARLIAADDKLFVVTRGGKLYAFGAAPREPKVYPLEDWRAPLAEEAVRQAKAILDTTSAREGYCLVYEYSDGDFLEALVRNSSLNVIAFYPDPVTVDSLRRRFAAAGLYGKRLSVRVGDFRSLEAPPYLASLALVKDASALTAESGRDIVARLYEQTRPYGGILYLSTIESRISNVIENLNRYGLPNANIQSVSGAILVVREGALPGAGSWTHQYGNIANTVKSDDRRVRLPLGILWFGGNSNLDVLPRHGHGPPEQILDGRLFIEGMNGLSARDVYTGRVLWKQEIPGLNNEGVYFDETYQNAPLSTATNQIHLPGANARGSNFVVTRDRIYIAAGDRCVVLDPASGNILQTIQTPPSPNSNESDQWGYIGVYEDYLIAGVGMTNFSDFVSFDSSIPSNNRPFLNYDTSSSKRLVVMNRYTGQALWTFDASQALRHNAIAAGRGVLFCIDRTPDAIEQLLRRRGKPDSSVPRLIAFNLRDGSIRWESKKDVFGSWLSYSQERDVLLEATRNSRDMIWGESRTKMAAYRGSDGTPLWKNAAAYNGPCILHGDSIITDPHSYDLLTGEMNLRSNPITGGATPWTFVRQHGCNYAIASEYLMTFRSAAAGFYNLEQDAGTGNFGGFKSGCTSNLIVADGVLNAPDYTRTCSCSYQNQTSLAMIHDPRVEMWTYNDIDLGRDPIQRLGLNFGAPGDRRADNGTLWLEYPIVGGPSPAIAVVVDPTEPAYFRHHSERMNGGELDWVCASGLRGVREIALPAPEESTEPLLYTVRLYFAEPDELQPGQRVFDVFLQGRMILKDFDIVREAGSIRRELMKEFSPVAVSRQLNIQLQPAESASIREPVLCGIELILRERPVSD